jgi:predicted enzyme involved in methoxymalonyl-ACP biosynthesis
MADLKNITKTPFKKNIPVKDLYENFGFEIENIRNNQMIYKFL